MCVCGGDITMFESISLSSEIKENKSATYVRSYNIHNRSQERTAKEVVVQHTDSQRMTRNCNSVGEKFST